MSSKTTTTKTSNAAEATRAESRAICARLEDSLTLAQIPAERPQA